jgi:hypothetical protein
MKLEIWKDVEDYPNYQISNFGNVKSKGRYVKVEIKNQKECLKKEKILKPQIDINGYKYVRLYNGGKWKYFKVHYLVAKTFIPNFNNKPTVDHIDRNKQNNEVSNLRWASYVEQANNKDKTNIIENMKKLGKKKYPNRAEKIKQYDINGNFIKEHNSSREAGKLLNISEKTISSCVNGHSKTAGGFIWKR